jgi:hypothetical protein
MNMIDSVGGFFGRKEDCIVLVVVFVRRNCSFFLVHVSVTLVNPVLCPFDA